MWQNRPNFVFLEKTQELFFIHTPGHVVSVGLKLFIRREKIQ